MLESEYSLGNKIGSRLEISTLKRNTSDHTVHRADQSTQSGRFYLFVFHLLYSELFRISKTDEREFTMMKGR